jgi:hypothetical protein
MYKVLKKKVLPPMPAAMQARLSLNEHKNSIVTPSNSTTQEDKEDDETVYSPNDRRSHAIHHKTFIISCLDCEDTKFMRCTDCRGRGSVKTMKIEKSEDGGLGTIKTTTMICSRCIGTTTIPCTKCPGAKKAKK